jgi:HEAT repeat protein
MTQPDAQVLQSLLRAVIHDPNVDVRLETVDALEKYSGDPDVRRALVDAIAVQESPLVQVALIDLVGKIRDRDAVPALRKLATDSEADETARQHATLALASIDATKGVTQK